MTVVSNYIFICWDQAFNKLVIYNIYPNTSDSVKRVYVQIGNAWPLWVDPQ